MGRAQFVEQIARAGDPRIAAEAEVLRRVRRDVEKRRAGIVRPKRKSFDAGHQTRLCRAASIRRQSRRQRDAVDEDGVRRRQPSASSRASSSHAT